MTLFVLSVLCTRSATFPQRRCCYIPHILSHKSSSVYHMALFHLLYTLNNPLFHIFWLKRVGSLEYILMITPAFPQPGVAGTKITASIPLFLYQSLLFFIFPCSCSSLLHSLGRCNDLSHSCSASFIALYTLRAESATSYLNVLLYPEYRILKTFSLTFPTTLFHDNSLLQFSWTLRASWVRTVLLVPLVSSHTFKSRIGNSLSWCWDG